MPNHPTTHYSALLAIIAIMMRLASSAPAQSKARARDLGIPFDGTPGPLNAITDVQGVEVGYTTLISGSGKLKVGEGPVRTGVTAVLPRGKNLVWRSGVRRMVFAERQWRDDRHDLGGRVRLSRRTGDDHQHPQRRRRARCCHPMARATCQGPGRQGVVGSAGGRRNLRWLLERHKWLPCEARARVSRH